MNIVEAFKIIKADETKCARPVNVTEFYPYWCLEARISMSLIHSGAEWHKIFAKEIPTYAILSDWEVFPIASLNNQEESK